VVGSRSKEKSHPANHDGISDPHGKRPTKRIVSTSVQSQYATEVRNLTSEVEGEVQEFEANEAHADDDMSSDNSQADEAPNDADDFMLPKRRNLNLTSMEDGSSSLLALMDMFFVLTQLESTRHVLHRYFDLAIQED